MNSGHCCCFEVNLPAFRDCVTQQNNNPLTKLARNMTHHRPKLALSRPLRQDLPSAHRPAPRRSATAARQRSSRLLLEASRAALKSATNAHQTWARHQWAQIATSDGIYGRTLQCMGLTQSRVSRSCRRALGEEPKSRQPCRQAWGGQGAAWRPWCVVEGKIKR